MASWATHAANASHAHCTQAGLGGVIIVAFRKVAWAQTSHGGCLSESAADALIGVLLAGTVSAQLY